MRVSALSGLNIQPNILKKIADALKLGWELELSARLSIRATRSVRSCTHTAIYTLYPQSIKFTIIYLFLAIKIS